jgi:flavin reductase (DIM6/NTAB) family NADH-FMN oxidoreductase RutF
MPVILIGSVIGEKPPMIMISSNQNHFTNRGIKKNKTFSVNFTSEEILKETDYCGLISGKDTDKSEIFEVFYGDLKTAPLIAKSPVNLECKVDQIIDNNKGHDIIIGEIKNVFSEDKFLTNGIPDVTKFHPLIFTMNDNNYWGLGKHLGRAWSIGKDYKKE